MPQIQHTTRIPVGCVPSAAVAGGWGVGVGEACTSACTRQGVCIPACTGQGCVYPSMHWAGVYVSQHALGRGVCIPACTWQGSVCPGGVCPGVFLPGGGQCLLGGGCLPHTRPPFGLNDRRLWKYYLAATKLRTVTRQYSWSPSLDCTGPAGMLSSERRTECSAPDYQPSCKPEPQSWILT